MNNQSFISICIPAYKNIDYVKRLLDSIAVQTYKNFEVIITDDSSDSDIESLCNSYSHLFELRYVKNLKNLNTPENWNEAVRHARYEWIKIMHDDDWLATPDSLLFFAQSIVSNPNAQFFFSSYSNVYDHCNRIQHMYLSAFWKRLLKGNPEILISENVIGPPSVTLYKKNHLLYDREMKYVVDIDFYTRYLEDAQWHYINKPLIHVGISHAQVTKYTFGVAEVHLKESLLMLHKKSETILKNIVVFDGWWRLMRNFKIKQAADIQKIGFSAIIPPLLTKLILFQSKIPSGLLSVGLLSKLMMSCCYLKIAAFKSFRNIS